MPHEIPIGPKLNKLRLQSGISLRKLAEQTNLSASFLNQVEHGKAHMSLNSLQAVAEALGVNMLYFLAEDQALRPAPIAPSAEENISTRSPLSQEGAALFRPVVSGGERTKFILPLGAVEYELLVPSLGQKMVAVAGRLSPDAGNIARKFREPTEEFIYVLEGQLLVGLAGGDYILSSGDTIYFKGEDLRTLACVSPEQDAAWISVITPAVF